MNNIVNLLAGMPAVIGKILPFLVIILGMLVIILIHEFGHFITAKLSGVQVNEFAIGFGPTIFKFQKGETKYSIRLLPLGGFCVMEGEDGESDNPRAFGRKKVWKRMIIIAAGATFNIILGFFLAIGIFAPQKSFQTTQISGFTENAKSYETGLRTGDKIVKIDGRGVYTVSDLAYLLNTKSDGIYNMTVKRNGEKVNLPKVQLEVKASDKTPEVVIDFGVATRKNSFFTTIQESAARTVSWARIIAMTLLDMITGKLGLSQISGPVGVVQAGAQAASAGMTDLLAFLCMITINLGIFNLLPIPGLDGGRLLFLIVEAVRRKPIPPKYEGVIHAAGIILLFGLIIVVSFKDIFQLIAG